MLRNKPWISFISIISLTLGLHVILSLASPEFIPGLQERLAARGLSGIALALGVVCAVLPIFLLRILVEEDKEDDHEL